MHGEMGTSFVEVQEETRKCKGLSKNPSETMVSNEAKIIRV